MLWREWQDFIDDTGRNSFALSRFCSYLLRVAVWTDIKSKDLTLIGKSQQQT